MANISITRRCDRNCDWCFAVRERADGKLRDMPQNVYERVLNFLERSSVRDVRLLGGEPTLHPTFQDYVDLALKRSFHVLVFTGGLMPSSAAEYLATLPSENISVVLNVVMPGDGLDELVEMQRRLCTQLSGRVELGVTIHAASQELGHLLDWVLRYDLQRRIRVGLAQPIYGGGNRFVRTPQCSAAGSAVEELVLEAADRGIAVDLDCGWTPCMFSEEFLEHCGELRRTLGTRCNPVVDILPEGEIVSCYPLAGTVRLRLESDSTRDTVIERFEQLQRPFRSIGMAKSCTRCEYREQGRCQGGCLARGMGRIRFADERALGE